MDAVIEETTKVSPDWSIHKLVPVKPVWAETADRKQVASIGRITREDVPPMPRAAPSTAFPPGGRASVIRATPIGLQHARPVNSPSVHDHLTIARQVIGGRKQSGVSRDSRRANMPGGRTSPRIHFSPRFSVGAMRGQTRVGFVAGVFHPERAEDVLGRELVNGFAAHALYQFCQNNVVDVGINKFRSGFGQRRKFPDRSASPPRALLVILDVVIGDQS